MSISLEIPIEYYSWTVGMALVDGTRKDILELTPWNLRIPARVRCLANRRPDIILEVLRSDPFQLAKCLPCYWLNADAYVLLSDVVLRPGLAELCAKGGPYDDIVALASSIGRVIYLTPNRLDCRSTNIRELQRV